MKSIVFALHMKRLIKVWLSIEKADAYKILADAVCWTLQTPEKDIRNRHLYEKHGYLAVDSVEINEYLSLIQYRKQLKETL